MSWSTGAPATASTAASFGVPAALAVLLACELGLTEARRERALELISRRGRGALTIGRATPGLRTVTVLAAAASGQPASALVAPLGSRSARHYRP